MTLASGLKIAALLPFLLLAVLFTTDSTLAKAVRRLPRLLKRVCRPLITRARAVRWPRVGWQKLKWQASTPGGPRDQERGLEPILRLFRHNYNRKEKLFFGLFGFQLTTLLVGTAISFVEVESILLTGPVLSAVGFAVAFLAVQRLEQPLLFAIFGLSASLVSYLCFLAIAGLELSVREAVEVIPPALLVYAVCASYLAFHAAGQTPLGDRTRTPLSAR